MKTIVATWLLASGCMASNNTIVRDVDIVGHDLVVESCRIHADKDTIKLGQCRTRTEHLPVLVAPTSATPTTPPFTLSIDRKAFARQLADARPALQGCAVTQSVPADLRIRFVFAPSGETSIEVADASPEVATCVESALATMRIQFETASIAFTFKPESQQP